MNTVVKQVRRVTIDLGSHIGGTTQAFSYVTDEDIISAKASCWCTSLVYRNNVLNGNIKLPPTLIDDNPVEKSFTIETENMNYVIQLKAKVYVSRKSLEESKVERVATEGEVAEESAKSRLEDNKETVPTVHPSSEEYSEGG